MAAASSSEYDRALPENRDKRHKDLIDKAKIEAYMSVRNAQSEEEDAEHGSKRCADCKEHWESCERHFCQHGLCNVCANKRRQRRLTARKTYTDNHYIVCLEEYVDELEYVKKQLAARDATIKTLEQKNEQLAHENVLLRCGHYGNDQNITSTCTYPSATSYQYASVPATQVQ
ncbi:hypothetical protein AAVH_10215 [Aphelenchoides avenae]|nr:hypothetical protein AAVH_10215 [Aphelenchus avenae]